MARKPKTSKPTQKVKFTAQPSPEARHEAANMDNMLNAVKSNLSKSVKPQTIKRDIEKKYDKSKVAYSSREYSSTYDGVETKGWRRLEDAELRELSQVDPYISAIISTRCSQAAIVARPSDSKFDKGTRVMELAPLLADDFETIDQFRDAQKRRQLQMEAILKWFQTCGNHDKDVLNAAFAGADPTFKFCSLPEFVTAQIRNILTFGRCGTQIFRNDEMVPSFFRPVPIETIYHGDPNNNAHLGTGEETAEQSLEDAAEWNAIQDIDERPHHYIQKIDGRNANFYTEDDLKVWHFQKQALFDLRGYPLSPIEQAIYMVFVHQQTLGYLRNQFVKGLATKGILTLESTEPAAQLSDEDVEQLRRDFHNFVNRNDNSAAVPVISGPVKVGFVQLSPTPNDMGFLQIEEHVVRALCSAFQVSPQEMGYGHLSIGQGGLNQANKQEEIIRGEERGLRMLLDIVYDGLNEILYENFPEAKELYRITYVGVGEDTRDAVAQRQQAELQTTATLSGLWADSEKTDPVPYGGNVPLAAAFHANVVKYMKYGVFMEHFMGEDGASKKPEYDFIIDPNLNQQYQALRVQPIRMQQEQAALQTEQMEMQMQQGEQAMQLAQQQGDAQAAVAAHGNTVAAGQPAPPADEGGQDGEDGEEVEKSLADEYRSRSKLAKSVQTYFKHWIDVHNG